MQRRPPGNGTALPFVSWPAPRAGPPARPRACLCQPSTTGGAETGKVVDGRAKPGHDAMGTTVPQSPYFNAYAGLSGPSVAARAWPRPGLGLRSLDTRVG